MKNISTIAIFIIILSILFSCNNNPKPKPPQPEVKEADFVALVNTWNQAHNSKDYEKFENLYADNVVFYQTDLNRNKCVEKKSSLLKKHSDFKQSIEGEIKIEYISETEVKCSFVKKASWNGNTEQYPSYLIFIKVGKEWKISTEGDSITDQNLEMMKTKTSGKVNIKFGGNKGTMWLEYPKFYNGNHEDDFGECDGPCNCYIKFSDSSVPSIKLENCIGGTPVNEGDLNSDGIDEIGILPSWWTSCWHEYKVYTLKNNKWELLVAVDTHCNQWDDGVDCISKDKTKPGYVKINYSEFTDQGIVLKTKTLKVN